MCRPIKGTDRQIIDEDVAIRVLLEHLHIVERIAAVTKILNKPGAGVSSVPENLPLNKGLRAGTRFGEKRLAGQLGMGGKRII